MRCNKCGAPNPDDRLSCLLCGHKLQSGRGGGDEAGEADASGPASASRPATGPDRDTPGVGRDGRTETSRPAPAPLDQEDRPPSPLLDFQGWANPLRGLGPYLEASLYAGVLAVAVALCLWIGLLWPLYPLLAVLGVVAWLRRL